MSVLSRAVFLVVLAALVASLVVAPASAQVSIISPPVQQPGPPDLVPRVTSSASWLQGMPFFYLGVHDTAVLTVTVENRPSVYASNPKAVIYQGSPAANVGVYVDLGPLLRQVGNMTSSGGWTCGTTTLAAVSCSGASIPVGGSASVTIEALALPGRQCRQPNWVSIIADPNNTVGDADESNNQAGAIIWVSTIC
jgi:hypothetical protein